MSFQAPGLTSRTCAAPPPTSQLQPLTSHLSPATSHFMHTNLTSTRSNGMLGGSVYQQASCYILNGVVFHCIPFHFILFYFCFLLLLFFLFLTFQWHATKASSACRITSQSSLAALFKYVIAWHQEQLWAACSKGHAAYSHSLLLLGIA